MLQAKQILGLIKTHKERANMDRTEWAKYARWYQSEFYNKSHEEFPSGSIDGDFDQSDGGRSSVTLETNYPYAFIDTMVANVCPISPNVNVIARQEHLKESAKFREALINDTLRRNKMHEKLWKACTQASVYRRSFMKIVWNNRRELPIFRVIDPKFVWFDLSCEEWDDVRYIIEVTVLTKQDFNKRIKSKGKGYYSKDAAEKAQFSGYPSWLKDESRNSAMYTEAARDIFEWVTIYEVYDFTAEEGRFYHFLDNSDIPLMSSELPFKYIRNPFFMLTLNDNLTDIGGLSDVKLIASAQERLNELDTLELWHAQSSIPIMLVNSSNVDNAEALTSALQTAGMGDIIQVEGKHKMSLNDLIGTTPVPSLSPSFNNMRQETKGGIEFVLGISQYQRGGIGIATVATEVAVADNAARMRNGRRQKRINDALAWASEGIICLYDEYMPEAANLAMRLTGEKESVEVNRQNMALRDLRDESGEEAFSYDYEAIPTNSMENNKQLQVKNIQDNMGMMQLGMQTGFIEPGKFMDKFLTLLAMPDLFNPAGNQQQLAQGPQDPNQPMQPGQDTLAGGALPPGMEVPLPIAGAAGGPGIDGAPVNDASIDPAQLGVVG